MNFVVLGSERKKNVCLFRCMITRRENPDGGLWGLAVKSFNQLLVDDIRNLIDRSGTDLSTNRPARVRLWKEVADVYEIFLVGYCGRALPSNTLAAISKEDDESLEMELLDVLGDEILMSDIDASSDVKCSYCQCTYIVLSEVAKWVGWVTGRNSFFSCSNLFYQ